jgi:uncharacterized cupin superfamily protein
MVAPRIEEVQAAARQDACAGLFQRAPGSFEIVDDETDVSVRVGLLGATGRERDELVTHVDEGHALTAAAQREVEDPSVELERLVDVGDLHRNVVHADQSGTLHHRLTTIIIRMDPVNVYNVELTRDDDDPKGYEAGYVRLGPLLGSEKLGASVYELEQGNSNCPYHYEYGNEEWLLVLSGKLTVRHPGGETELSPGDLACFPNGPDGAHKLTNKHAETARLVVFSTKVDPSMAVYPDSDKIAAWPGPGGEEDGIRVRRESKVDYWDREVD